MTALCDPRALNVRAGFGESFCIYKFELMLTQQQKAEAEKKLKNINEELAIEDELRNNVSNRCVM